MDKTKLNKKIELDNKTIFELNNILNELEIAKNNVKSIEFKLSAKIFHTMALMGVNPDKYILIKNEETLFFALKENQESINV